MIVQSLPEADLEDVLSLLRTGDERAHSAEGAWKAVPPAPITITTTPDSDERGTDPAALPGIPFAAVTSASRPLTPVLPLTPPASEESGQPVSTARARARAAPPPPSSRNPGQRQRPNPPDRSTPAPNRPLMSAPPCLSRLLRSRQSRST